MLFAKRFDLDLGMIKLWAKIGTLLTWPYVHVWDKKGTLPWTCPTIDHVLFFLLTACFLSSHLVTIFFPHFLYTVSTPLQLFPSLFWIYFPFCQGLFTISPPFLLSLSFFCSLWRLISVSISLYLYRPLHGCRHNQCERGGDDASCPLANRSDAYTDMMSQFRHRRSFPLLHFTPNHVISSAKMASHTLTLETGSRHRTRKENEREGVGSAFDALMLPLSIEMSNLPACSSATGHLKSQVLSSLDYFFGMKIFLLLLLIFSSSCLWVEKFIY